MTLIFFASPIREQYNHPLSLGKDVFAGVMYDHEFEGQSKMSVGNVKIKDVPDTSGGTTVFQVGTNIRSQEFKKVTINIHVKGYVGEQEGMSGNLQLNYDF